MAVLVQKFGGTSVADTDCIRRVAAHIARTQREGHQVIAVVSAMAGDTDRLATLGHQLSSEPESREYDALVSSGEQLSSALLAIALNEQGVCARSYAGHQIPIYTDQCYSKARILRIETDKLREAISRDTVPVIAGFQGVDAPTGNITTLGRGGSDITAVAIAAAMRADECQILTDVLGVYTADPRLVPQARRLAHLTYDEMLELSSLGSQILQIRSVEFAQKYRIPLRVMSSFEPDAGTLIAKQESDVEQAVVSGIAFDRHQAMISVESVPLASDFIVQLLAQLGDAAIDVDLMVQGSPNSKQRMNFNFTVHRNDYQHALALVESLAPKFDAGHVVGRNQVVKLALVGVGMRSHAGVAATMFRCLNQEQVKIQLIATSEIKISAIVEEACGAQAVRALHSAFKLDTTDTVLT